MWSDSDAGALAGPLSIDIDARANSSFQLSPVLNSKPLNPIPIREVIRPLAKRQVRLRS